MKYVIIALASETPDGSEKLILNEIGDALERSIYTRYSETLRAPMWLVDAPVVFGQDDPDENVRIRAMWFEDSGTCELWWSS
jgi:hypothetical protein